MEFIKKLVHILSIICYVLIIVYALVCIPNLFGYKPLVVLSGSMEPTIKEGSVLYYKSVDENELKVGDIITFELNGEYISHRINGIENNLYETKGDANDVADPVKISYNEIKGKDSSFTISYIGNYIKFVNSNLYLIGVVVIILVLEFLFSNLEIFNINSKGRRA